MADMKGMNPDIFKGDPEKNLIRKEDVDFDRLIERFSTQAERVFEAGDIQTQTRWTNPTFYKEVLSQSNVSDQKVRALELFRENHKLAPDYLRDGDEDTAAFLIAMANYVHRSVN